MVFPRYGMPWILVASAIAFHFACSEGSKERGGSGGDGGSDIQREGGSGAGGSSGAVGTGDSASGGDKGGTGAAGAVGTQSGGTPGGQGGNVTGGTTGGGNAGAVGGVGGGAVVSGGAVGSGGLVGTGGAAGVGACSAVFCEDFETGLSSNVWTQEKTNATIEVQSVEKAHGRQALHVHINGNGGTAFIVEKKSFPGLGSHFFGRAFLKVAPDLAYGHTGIFVARGPKGNLEIGSYEGGFQLTAPNKLNGGGPIPANVFSCVEWEIDDTASVIRTWVNGQSRAQLTNFGTSVTGGMNAFAFGMKQYHPPTYAVDVYVDDIVLDTQRVSCPVQ